MPAGNPWLTEAPTLRHMPTDGTLWHVYPAAYSPLSANTNSQARMALLGTHGMFYVADSLAGALWETLLRYVVPDKDRNVQVPVGKLRGQMAVELRLKNTNVPMLELGHPGLMALFPLDSPEAQDIDRLLNDPNHGNTHGPARDLHDELKTRGFTEMPVLSWDSRQNRKKTAYLVYAPPMTSDWWTVVGKPIELDDPVHGYHLLQHELAQHGFHWTPLATSATTGP